MKGARAGDGSRLWGRLGGHDAYELAIFTLLGLLSLWVLAWLLGRSIANGEVWTGVDSLHASDPFQYLAWIRDLSHSLLISNLFEIRPSAASFLHPGFLISGLIVRLGVAPWLAYLLWKPVAVVALFLGVRAYAHRLIPSAFGRRTALILAFFFVSTAAYVGTLVGVGARSNLYLLGLEVELWTGTWLWGYSFTVLAVAAMPAVLLLYGRDRRRGRIGPWGPIAALLCSWFQPWQGATLVGILVISELLSPRLEPEVNSLTEDQASPARRHSRLGLRQLTFKFGGGRLSLLTTYVMAGAVPLVYYAALERLDPSWTLNGEANRFGAWPVWTLLVSIAPLAIPAALAYTKRPRTFQDVALRVWPLTALAVYWVIALSHIGTFPIHALQGLVIPLSVLAVIGIQARVRITGRLGQILAVLAVAALTIPALVWKLNDAQNSTMSNGVAFPGAPPNPFYLTTSEANALAFLSRDRTSGGVLATAYLGEVTPARTGRRTWVGLPSWTPHYVQRSQEAESLFNGDMSPASAIAFVRSTGALFVLTDCAHHADVERLISPIVLEAHRFGCSTVIRVQRS